MNKILFNPYLDEKISEKSRLVVFNNNIKKFVVTEVIEAQNFFELDIEGFDKNMNYTYHYQVRGFKEGTERWINKTLTKRLYNEKCTEDGIKYIFFQEESSDKLVVIFQAINKTPTYNYIGTLANMNINRLYIKDDYGGDKATRSSYYLGQGKNLEIAHATQILIKKILEEHNLKKENLICCGSSKGGFAALYHGYKIGAGYILPGGPQILLGDYLYQLNPKSIRHGIFKSVIGDMTIENKEWANLLLYNIIKSSTYPLPITIIHIGEKEPHFKNHIVPFINWVKTMGISNVSIDKKNYSTHDELAKYYPIFLKNEINKIIM